MTGSWDKTLKVGVKYFFEKNCTYIGINIYWTKNNILVYEKFLSDLISFKTQLLILMLLKIFLHESYTHINLKKKFLILNYAKVSQVLLYIGDVRYNSAALDAFAKVVKVTKHTGLWDAKLTWYSECYSP